jgi:hypothetical protein
MVGAGAGTRQVRLPNGPSALSPVQAM